MQHPTERLPIRRPITPQEIQISVNEAKQLQESAHLTRLDVLTFSLLGGALTLMAIIALVLKYGIQKVCHA